MSKNQNNNKYHSRKEKELRKEKIVICVTDREKKAWNSYATKNEILTSTMVRKIMNNAIKNNFNYSEFCK